MWIFGGSLQSLAKAGLEEPSPPFTAAEPGSGTACPVLLDGGV